MSRKRGIPKPAVLPATKQGTDNSFLISWLCYGSFILLGLLVYIPAIGNGFIWDDDVMVTDNVLMKAPDGLWRIWFTMELSDYYPLTSTLFWFEWRIWGMNPMGYNVLNILLHILGAILLWRVLLRLKVPGAWLAAILFTVHPVCVASVDWIAERKNTLSLVFYMAALLLYLRFDQEKHRRFYWFAIVAFFLALLSKASVVVLPLVLLLCAWWQRGRITKQDLVQSIPFFSLALVFGLLTVWVQLHEVLLGERPETDTIFSRVMDGSWAIWFYLGKILWPSKLSITYPRWEINEQSWLSYLPGFLWLIILLVAWHYRRTWGRPFLFSLGYFTIALFPVLGFFDMQFLVFSPVADHLQYIAVPGIIALAVGLGFTFWQRAKAKYSWRSDGPRYTAAVVAIFALSLLTWKQSSVYADQEKLWRDAIKKYPTAWIAHHNLADRLAELRRFQEAAVYYEKSLKLKPDYAKTHNNLGNCLQILGHFDQAVDQFLDAIQDKPEMAEAHHNLGVLYYRKKDFAKALECFKKAIELKPGYVSALFSAGNAAIKLGDLDSAVSFYFTASRYDPDEPEVHYNLGIVLSVQGATNTAIQHLQQTLRLNPDHDLAKKELQLLLAHTDNRR